MKTKNLSQESLFKDEQLNICILGGGNIGTLLLGDLGVRDNISLRLLTSKPDKWSNKIEVCSIDNTINYTGRIDMISNNARDVIVDADIIISTLPSHIFPIVINKIKPFIKRGAWIGAMPGSGGVEFYSKELVESGCILFGFQRVHGIARIKEYGKSVYDLGKKKELHIASIPNENTEQVCNVMENLFKVKCHPLSNFLNVTLTPSNPILHTTRLYEIFHDYSEGIYWDRQINFYEDWTENASKMLIDCDEELQTICGRIIGLDLADVKSLKIHYESDTEEEMTEKISNIVAFKGIKTPMLKKELGYIPDFKSRYFLEDFPYGLCIIKGFADILDVNTPVIDNILMWFEQIANVSYYIDNEFVGEDLEKLPLPKNYGLNTVEDIISYYG